MKPKIAYLDCPSGISGTLLLGALLDAGLPVEKLLAIIDQLPANGHHLSVEPFSDRGIRGTQVNIQVEGGEEATWRFADIVSSLEAITLTPPVKEKAQTALHYLFTAEATMQGSRLEDVLLSERDALGRLVKIVGVLLGMETLGVRACYVSPLPLTHGHRRTAQGLAPLPSPITLEILRQKGATWRPCPIEEELVTPVGATLLATLARFETPAMTIEKIGYGCGRSDLPWVRCLRLCLGDPLEVAQEADTDRVVVIESHIDNMSGELLGGLMDRLFALGALDVSYTPIHMKKNRPATLVTVICSPEQGEHLAMVILRETSTLGVRIQQVKRLKAQRSQERIKTPLGPMLVKIKRLGQHIISASPEYEDCQRVAREQNLPLEEVYEVAWSSARALLL
jgi:uncharacterized protein (TIGR00299 family) protein